MNKKSKDVEYPKNYVPISHVKPKSKLRRRINELIHGEKTYLPASEALKREQESLTTHATRLRKAQNWLNEHESKYNMRRKKK